MNVREQIEYIKGELNIVHDNDLAEKINVRPQVLAQWVLRDKISKEGRHALLSLGFSKELFGNIPKNDSGRQHVKDEPMSVSKITDCNSQVEMLQSKIKILEAEIDEKNEELKAALIKADAFENLVVRLSGGQTPGKSTPSPKTLEDGQAAGTSVKVA